MPISVPASCDFMVAQPPSYEESVRNNIQTKKHVKVSQPVKEKETKLCVIL